MEITAQELHKIQKRLELEFSNYEDWEEMQTKRRNSPANQRDAMPPEGYFEKRGELFYNVMGVNLTDNGMFRVDMDVDAYVQLAEKDMFWQAIGQEARHLSEKLGKQVDVKVRGV